MLAIFLAKEMNGAGKICLLKDPGWKSVGIRGDMVEKVLGDYPNIEIVARQDVSVDPINTSYTIVKSVLQSHPDLKAVFAAWGLPSVGAAQAIEEMGLSDRIVIATADNDKAILEAMSAEGAPRWVTIGQDSANIGYNAAVAMDNLLSGRKDLVQYTTYGPTYLTANIPLNEAFFEYKFVSLKDMWSIAFGDGDNPF
jgi:ABC-type sugar transport system substrate-binding protein